MLKRPRYPVIVHSGQPTALKSFAPGGNERCRTLGDRLGGRNATDGTDPPHEPLGHDATECGGDLVRLHAHVYQAGDGIGRIVGVQRAEDEVTGQRRLHGDLRRLLIPDFTDQHDVGVLPEDRAQRRGESEPRFLVDLHLDDVFAQPVFDRVFDGHDVHALALNQPDAPSRASSSSPSRWAP